MLQSEMERKIIENAKKDFKKYSKGTKIANEKPEKLIFYSKDEEVVSQYIVTDKLNLLNYGFKEVEDQEMIVEIIKHLIEVNKKENDEDRIYTVNATEIGKKRLKIGRKIKHEFAFISLTD